MPLFFLLKGKMTNVAGLMVMVSMRAFVLRIRKIYKDEIIYY